MSILKPNAKPISVASPQQKTKSVDNVGGGFHPNLDGNKFFKSPIGSGSIPFETTNPQPTTSVSQPVSTPTSTISTAPTTAPVSTPVATPVVAPVNPNPMNGQFAAMKRGGHVQKQHEKINLKHCKVSTGDKSKKHSNW